MADTGTTRLHTSAISRRRVIRGVAWTTPAILVATASPPAAASTGGGTTPPVTGAAMVQNHVGGGSGWDGPPRNVTIQFGYHLKVPATWPAAIVIPTSWTISLRNAQGDIVGTASGVGALSQAGGVTARGVITVPARGSYRATYVVTASPVTVNGIVYQADDLVSAAAYQVVVSQLAW
ncbi:hypothetical protein [Demequina rhizosphaerae]|uniref:hypothetical protein n=1 Tax=Demequina rhizosphaerae TaxID=1638985 RepID=UPI000780E40D|nr:hypothetical protein [Demequina rhizosphaerae]